MAEELTKEQIIEALKKVRYPGYSRDIVSFGMVGEISVDGSQVALELVLTSEDPQKRQQLEDDVRKTISGLPGVSEVEIKVKSPPSPQATARPAAARPRGEEELWTRAGIPGVRHIIPVGSGKGGVGKSTVAVNLALALAQRGARVGLVDADVHGPNIPGMLGLFEKPKAQNNKILPLTSGPIKVISLGFFLDQKEPIIWRGPLVGGLVQQFFNDVDWGELDYLIVDLPPGTGDAQLTLVQKVALTGAIIVTTPQDVALQDAMKGLAMFQKLEVPVLGVIENMSYFVCPHCGKRTEIFDHGGGERESQARGVAFLGEVPLELGVRVSGDEGKPIVMSDPQSPAAQAFFMIAEQLEKVVQEQEAKQPAPAS
ncbi:MAG: Mrp/NBP35 family ATP-binding protein [Chloroflexi bacterium]|nr:Mrp/NBP35 family ATP-binding protein [Chloroflexota bacterium]